MLAFAFAVALVLATTSPAALRRPVLNVPERDGAKISASGGGAPRELNDGGGLLRRPVLDMPERDGAKASASGGGAPRELNDDRVVEIRVQGNYRTPEEEVRRVAAIQVGDA